MPPAQHAAGLTALDSDPHPSAVGSNSRTSRAASPPRCRRHDFTADDRQWTRASSRHRRPIRPVQPRFSSIHATQEPARTGCPGRRRTTIRRPFASVTVTSPCLGTETSPPSSGRRAENAPSRRRWGIAEGQPSPLTSPRFRTRSPPTPRPRPGSGTAGRGADELSPRVRRRGSPSGYHGGLRHAQCRRGQGSRRRASTWSHRRWVARSRAHGHFEPGFVEQPQESRFVVVNEPSPK